MDQKSITNRLPDGKSRGILGVEWNDTIRWSSAKGRYFLMANFREIGD